MQQSRLCSPFYAAQKNPEMCPVYLPMAFPRMSSMTTVSAHVCRCRARHPRVVILMHIMMQKHRTTHVRVRRQTHIKIGQHHSPVARFAIRLREAQAPKRCAGEDNPVQAIHMRKRVCCGCVTGLTWGLEFPKVAPAVD